MYERVYEFKNTSDQVVDLSGMYLTDRAQNALKWQFPEGVQLGPGEYLLVWADENSSGEPELHANFKLAREDETVWLYDTVANGYALLDCVTFDDLAQDQSFVRSPDGTGPPQVLSVPTPAGPNAEPMR